MTTAALDWESQPADDRASKFAAVKAALRERPGQWAEVIHPDGWTNNRAYSVRRCWGRAGFEVRPQMSGGVTRVWARYVGADGGAQ